MGSVQVWWTLNALMIVAYKDFASFCVQVFTILEGISDDALPTSLRDTLLKWLSEQIITVLWTILLWRKLDEVVIVNAVYKFSIVWFLLVFSPPSPPPYYILKQLWEQQSEMWSLSISRFLLTGFGTYESFLFFYLNNLNSPIYPFSYLSEFLLPS